MSHIVRCRTERTITITYETPVTRCLRMLHVFPANQRGGQTVESLYWTCTPRQDNFSIKQDSFGNEVLGLVHRGLGRRFCFEMEMVTAQKSTFDGLNRETGLSETQLGAFLLPSALADFNGVVLPMARHVQGKSAQEICAAVHEMLVYEPGQTFVDTPASQALAQGSGVCQDFAHVMIALCRAVKLPARYVGGYSPTEGGMHAWVEVLENDRWYSWDPTHNQPTRSDCVFVAAGRDFRDVPPIYGVYQGGGKAQLNSHCATKVIKEG